MTQKPFSQACENNKHAISKTLQPYVSGGGLLLEIGSGTGQHGAFMSECFPSLVWQTSDRIEYHAGINTWVNDVNSDNFLAPLMLDVNQASWRKAKVDYVFSANTLHIMSWPEVKRFFAFAPTALKDRGLLFIYGPFNYGGHFTSQSNEHFNGWLREQAEHMAIRDFESVNALASNHGFTLIADHEMPANNRLLVFAHKT